MIPYHSHDVPKHNNQLPKADLRAEISAFGLLVWTYADQRVRAASEQGLNDTLGPRVATSTVLGRLGDSVVGNGRGTINGRLEPHGDAWTVDEMVKAWFDHDGVRHAYVAWYLEKRRRVPHASEAYLCLLEWKGHTAKHLAYVAEIYQLFDGLLNVLVGVETSRWRVVNRG